jgi:hypothetical protein
MIRFIKLWLSRRRESKRDRMQREMKQHWKWEA